MSQPCKLYTCQAQKELQVIGQGKTEKIKVFWKLLQVQLPRGATFNLWLGGYLRNSTLDATTYSVKCKSCCKIHRSPQILPHPFQQKHNYQNRSGDQMRLYTCPRSFVQRNKPQNKVAIKCRYQCGHILVNKKTTFELKGRPIVARVQS